MDPSVTLTQNTAAAAIRLRRLQLLRDVSDICSTQRQAVEQTEEDVRRDVEALTEYHWATICGILLEMNRSVRAAVAPVVSQEAMGIRCPTCAKRECVFHGNRWKV